MGFEFSLKNFSFDLCIQKKNDNIKFFTDSALSNMVLQKHFTYVDSSKNLIYWYTFVKAMGQAA